VLASARNARNVPEPIKNPNQDQQLDGWPQCSQQLDGWPQCSSSARPSARNSWMGGPSALPVLAPECSPVLGPQCSVVHQVVHDSLGRRPVSPQQVAGPLGIRFHPGRVPFQVLPVHIDAKHPRVLPGAALPTAQASPASACNRPLGSATRAASSVARSASVSSGISSHRLGVTSVRSTCPRTKSIRFPHSASIAAGNPSQYLHGAAFRKSLKLARIWHENGSALSVPTGNVLVDEFIGCAFDQGGQAGAVSLRHPQWHFARSPVPLLFRAPVRELSIVQR